MSLRGAARKALLRTTSTSYRPRSFFTYPISPIGGLDECLDKDARTHLIQHLSSSMARYQLPLKFLILSRPEPHIKSTINLASEQSIISHLQLNDDFKPDEDILSNRQVSGDPEMPPFSLTNPSFLAQPTADRNSCPQSFWSVYIRLAFRALHQLRLRFTGATVRHCSRTLTTHQSQPPICRAGCLLQICSLVHNKSRLSFAYLGCKQCFCDSPTHLHN